MDASRGERGADRIPLARRHLDAHAACLRVELGYPERRRRIRRGDFRPRNCEVRCDAEIDGNGNDLRIALYYDSRHRRIRLDRRGARLSHLRSSFGIKLPSFGHYLDAPFHDDIGVVRGNASRPILDNPHLGRARSPRHAVVQYKRQPFRLRRKKRLAPRLPSAQGILDAHRAGGRHGVERFMSYIFFACRRSGAIERPEVW